MYKALIVSAALIASAAAFAQQVPSNTGAGKELATVPVLRNQLGTGTPAPMVTVGTENARLVDDAYYHVPQDMPYYPTAAVIWPRVVEVQCDNVGGKVLCDGYHWQPKYGRAEYLFIVPVARNTPQPVVVPPVVVPPVVIYKEVPVKKKGE